MYNYTHLDIPGTTLHIIPGSKLRLGRFESTIWIASHGWYTWGNNRPVCGWFLTDSINPNIVKPLQLSDLDDIYFIE